MAVVSQKRRYIYLGISPQIGWPCSKPELSIGPKDSRALREATSMPEYDMKMTCEMSSFSFDRLHLNHYSRFTSQVFQHHLFILSSHSISLDFPETSSLSLESLSQGPSL